MRRFCFESALRRAGKKENAGVRVREARVKERSGGSFTCGLFITLPFLSPFPPHFTLVASDGLRRGSRRRRCWCVRGRLRSSAAAWLPTVTCCEPAAPISCVVPSACSGSVNCGASLCDGCTRPGYNKRQPPSVASDAAAAAARSRNHDVVWDASGISD